MVINNYTRMLKIMGGSLGALDKITRKMSDNPVAGYQFNKRLQIFS